MAAKGHAGGKLASQAVARKGEHLRPPPRCSAEYRRLWKTTVEDFAPEFFQESDRITLEAYVGLSLTMRDMQEQLKDQPLMLDGAYGQKENPLIGSINKLAGRIIQYARSLRLTPSSRTQMNSMPAKSELKENDRSREQGAAKSGGIRLVN